MGLRRSLGGLGELKIGLGGVLAGLRGALGGGLVSFSENQQQFSVPKRGPATNSQFASRCRDGAGRVQGGCKEGARRVQGGCEEGARRVQGGCERASCNRECP